MDLHYTHIKQDAKGQNNVWLGQDSETYLQQAGQRDYCYTGM
jgi:hypothetical protein